MARAAGVKAGRLPQLRRRNRDDLGLRRALGDRVLPLLVAAMAFLAALAITGAVAARGLAGHWQEGAADTLTLQIPQPNAASGAAGNPSRVERAMALLHASPAVLSARLLGTAELTELLRPWFGADGAPPALPLPGVVALHLVPGLEAGLPALAESLAAAVPGADLEAHGQWVERLATLAASLQACAWLALAVVAGVAVMVIAVATRSGLVARRDAIQIVHGLGATDGYIASRFARRATALAALGATLGACLALPVLLAMASLAAPFTAEAQAAAPNWPWSIAAALPGSVWAALPALPLAAAGIGFVTAQGTVRRWLRRLP